ncbi:MAG: hypothetical protein R6U61_00085 [Thermoplasmata archaeon]
MDIRLTWTITILVTYVIGIIIFNPLLEKLRNKGFVGRDMYKKGHPRIPEMGGIGIAFAFLAGFLLLSVFTEIPYVAYLSVFVLMLYFLFGLLDDLLGIGGIKDVSYRKLIKIVIPLFFAFPLMNFSSDSVDIPYLGELYLGFFYPWIFLPVFIMVTSNLMNMYSYYNGQSAGTTVIVLFFLSMKLYSQGHMDIFYIIIPFLGATLAFLSYNVQPAGVFPGDSGDMLMGAAIGIVGVLSGYEAFVFIALLPLIINFLMVAAWFVEARGDLKVKFGDVRKDDTINPPNAKTLMWFFPSYIHLTERQTTVIMYILVLISSFTAWILF